MSQAGLAALVGTSQPQIRRLEMGERKLTKQWAERLAPHLHIDPVDLLFHNHKNAEASEVAANHHQMQIFAAAEGGKGEMVVSTDPIDVVPRPWYLKAVKDGYGVVVVGDSMAPKFEPGDIVIVNPKLPVLRNRPAIFVSGEETGNFTATVKLLLRETTTEWLVAQLNPKKEFSLPKKVWPKALRIVGTYEGS